MGRGDLPEMEWELIGPLLPPERGRWHALRMIIGAFSTACSTCCGSAATGAKCMSGSACPSEGRGQVELVYVRFRRSAEQGVWDALLQTLVILV